MIESLTGAGLRNNGRRNGRQVQAILMYSALKEGREIGWEPKVASGTFHFKEVLTLMEMIQ